MLSPTNYHIPSHIAEGLARYDSGEAELEEVIPEEELSGTYNVLDEITDPSQEILCAVGKIAGHEMLLIDDHTRPPRDFAVVDFHDESLMDRERIEFVII